MALHDFWCRVCGQVLADVNVPVAIGANAGAPDHCGQQTAWIPGATAMDVGGVKTAGFRAFDTTDGRGTPVRIDSLRKLRQIERESEVHARNGEGQPMVFRRWAQGASNADQPTLSKSYYGGDAPSPEAVQKFAPSVRRSLAEPDVPYGPGVSDANTSALPPVGKD